MKAVSILLLALTLASRAFAQGDIQSFEKQFKKALKKKKWEQLANCFDYPFSSYNWGYYLGPGNSGIDSKEEFLQIVDDVFNKKTVKTMLAEDFKKEEELYGNRLVYVLVFNRSENSTSWLVFQKIDGEWKAIKTDNVSRK